MMGSLDIGVSVGKLKDRVGNGWKVDTRTLIEGGEGMMNISKS